MEAAEYIEIENKNRIRVIRSNLFLFVSRGRINTCIAKNLIGCGHINTIQGREFMLVQIEEFIINNLQLIFDLIGWLGVTALLHLDAETLNATLSGLGSSVEVSGDVINAQIDTPGAGGVNAGDLKIRTADVSISGIGSATVWVTDQLNGNISGGGNVRYYGNPQTDVESSGIDQLESLGSK